MDSPSNMKKTDIQYQVSRSDQENFWNGKASEKSTGP